MTSALVALILAAVLVGTATTTPLWLTAACGAVILAAGLPMARRLEQR